MALTDGLLKNNMMRAMGVCVCLMLWAGCSRILHACIFDGTTLKAGARALRRSVLEAPEMERHGGVHCL